MKHQTIVAIALALVTSVSGWAQSDGVWSLDDCINRAKQENITLKRNRISAAQARLSVEDARKDRLPSVSFSTSPGLTSRPVMANSSSE